MPVDKPKNRPGKVVPVLQVLASEGDTWDYSRKEIRIRD
jgi:hypothetical protein